MRSSVLTLRPAFVAGPDLQPSDGSVLSQLVSQLDSLRGLEPYGVQERAVGEELEA